MTTLTTPGGTMIYGRPLQDRVNTDVAINRTLLSMWNTAVIHITSTEPTRTVKVDPVICRRYAYDFYGLLQYQNIPKEFFYPNLVANGLKTPLMYDGTVTDIAILNAATLATYYQMFNR